MWGERYFHCQGALRSTKFYEISSRSPSSQTVSIYFIVNEDDIALSRIVRGQCTCKPCFRDLFHVLFFLCLKRYPIFVALFRKGSFYVAFIDLEMYYIFLFDDLLCLTSSTFCWQLLDDPFIFWRQVFNLCLSCFHFTTLHGGWSSWGVWGSCRKTCGTGVEHRTRGWSPF